MSDRRTIFSNSNGVTFGTTGGTVTGSVLAQSNQQMTMFATGNTTQSSTGTTNASSLIFGGFGGVSVGITNGSVVISGATGGGAGDGYNILAAGTQTAQTTGTVSFADSNGITFGMSNSSIVTASHNGLTTQLAQAASGSNGSFTFQTLSFSNANGMSFGTSAGSAITGSYTVPTVPPAATISSYENIAGGLLIPVTQSIMNSTSMAVVFQLPQAISASFLRIPIAVGTASTAIASTASSANASGELYTTWQAVVYSMGTGANSRSLQSVASGSCGLTFRNSVSIETNGTQYSITQQLSHRAEGGQTLTSTQYSVSSSVLPLSTTFFSAAFTGSRWMDIDFANSLSPGPYWLIFGLSTSANTNSTRLTDLTACRVTYRSHFAATQVNSWWGIMGSTDMTSGGLLGMGSFSTAGGGTTASLPISAISSSASNVRPYFQLLRSA